MDGASNNQYGLTSLSAAPRESTLALRLRTLAGKRQGACLSLIEGAITEKRIYEKRIVAFGDILGWKDAIRDVSQVGSLQEAIFQIADYAGVFSKDFKQNLAKAQGVPSYIMAEHSGIEFCHFSDCFAVSAPVEYGEKVFGILSVAADKLLHSPRPFLVRGGVAIGEVYHRQAVIFGPALVEAVELEHSAHYPRFLCSDNLITHLDTVPFKHDVVFEDYCGQWAVNTAWGSPINGDELMKVLDAEINSQRPASNLFRWCYIKAVLPKMYNLKFKAYETY